MSAMADIVTGFILDKMRSTFSSPVEYELILDSGKVLLNPLIGKVLRLEYLGEMRCLNCSDPRVFQQGYCFRCTQTLPQCDFCILSPDKCHFHLGTCRDESFAQSHCFIPHLVYLSYSSHVKVGITRKGNETTRWVDQGAVAAVPLLQMRNRRASGRVEARLKEWFSDRTSWQKMLKQQGPDLEALQNARKEAISKIEEMGKDLLQGEDEPEFKVLSDAEIQEIHYPVEKFPDKVKSYDLKKLGSVEDRLMGIKGQYLVFEGGVLNLRKYQGYRIKFGSDLNIS
ncbi:DUF2797 domain-containing protein [bacterium]|nr:DUF2797 domain-containing protein [bacterium]